MKTLRITKTIDFVLRVPDDADPEDTNEGVNEALSSFEMDELVEQHVRDELDLPDPDDVICRGIHVANTTIQEEQ